MIVALILGENNRVIDYVPVDEAPESCPRIAEDVLPKGFLDEYRYVDGEFIHDPLPIVAEPEPQPTAEDVMNALLGVV